MKTAEQIFHLGVEIHRAIRHRFARLNETPWKINPLQLFALIAINDRDGISMRELAQHLKITSPSATAFADRLVKYKWIKRQHDPKNRKVIRLSITAEGREILASHLREKNQFIRDVMNLLPEKDQKELVRIMRLLLTNFPK